MKTLALSGWGQPYDALKELLPDAKHMDYARYDTPEAALSAMADTAMGYKRIVGWSLGGQLAVRAIAAGLVMPEKLVLIATPFQFVEMGKHSLGMRRDSDTNRQCGHHRHEHPWFHQVLLVLRGWPQAVFLVIRTVVGGRA